MGYLRFHRSRQLLPGVRLNIAKTGPSLSLGVNGARVNLGPQGIRTTVGLPGSGLSYIDRRSWPKPVAPSAAAPPQPGARFTGLPDMTRVLSPEALAAWNSKTPEGKCDVFLDLLRAQSIEQIEFQQFALEAYVSQQGHELDADTAPTLRRLYAEVLREKKERRSFIRWLVLILLTGFVLGFAQLVVNLQ